MAHGARPEHVFCFVTRKIPLCVHHSNDLSCTYFNVLGVSYRLEVGMMIDHRHRFFSWA